MVRAGARFRQAEGDVHGVVEIEEFERDESLVVIHGDDGVEVTAGGVAEHGIGHGGAGEDRIGRGVQTFDGRLDEARFLIAEGSVFAGVGIEAGNGDARPGDAAAFEETGGEVSDAFDAFGGEKVRHAGERFVDGGEADGQGPAGEEHAEVPGAEGMGEVFGLAGEGETEGLEGFLGDRAGDHGVGAVVLEFRDGRVQGGEGGGGGTVVRLSRDAGMAVAEDHEFKTAGQFTRGERSVDDFRADAGRIAEGDEDASHGVDAAAAGGRCQVRMEPVMESLRACRMGWRWIRIRSRMKSRDFQRSVRAQRYERSTGDAPILGRVGRMPRVASKGIRRRRKRGEGGGRAPGKLKSRRVILMWSAVLVMLTLVALSSAVWFWLRAKRHSAAGSAGTGGDLWPAREERVVSRFPSPTEDEALAMVKRAMAVRETGEVGACFRLGTATPAEVVDFLNALRLKDGGVTRYEWLSSMDANGLLLDGVLVETAGGGMSKNRLAMLTPDESGVWRVDFESFARVVKPSWDALLGGTAENGMVRVMVARDSYFNGPFREEDGWVCYGMASPDTDAVMSGYCRRDSPQAVALERILSKTVEEESPVRQPMRATLEIRRHESGGTRQFEITRVLAEDWVLGPVNYDQTVE